jgi:hypothetical protein
MTTLANVIGRGPTVSKPAADSVPVGSLYFDTDLEKMQRSNGTTWEDCAETVSGGGYTQGAMVYRNSTQSIPDGQMEVISFSTELWDTDAIFDAGSPTRLTCKTAGKYSISAHVAFASNTTGNRQVFIRKNGTDYLAGDIRQAVQTGGTRTVFAIETKEVLNVNDYVELIVFQTTGGSLNVDTLWNRSPNFGMQRIG